MFGRMGQPQSAPSAGRRRLTYKAGLKTHFAQLPPDQKCDLPYTPGCWRPTRSRPWALDPRGRARV